MQKYTVTYDDGKIRKSAEFDCPDRLPQAGDVYEFVEPVQTLANINYKVGDTLEIIGRTTKAPHHRTSSLGNLYVRCHYMTSVWTNLESSIARGWLKLIEANGTSV
jgi:hypothetical protein